MKLYLLLLLLLALSACSNQLNALKMATSEGGLQCPTRVSAPLQSSAFENVYKKEGRKVVFQNITTQSTLPKNYELSVLVDLECLTQKTLPTFLTQALKALPKKDFSKFSKVESYTVKIPKVMTFANLETIADSDACVIGVTQETYAELQSMPSDPRVADQSYLSSIRFPEIYDDVFTSSKKLTGEYLVGVIDGGYFMGHPDLQNQWWTNPNEIPDNNIDDDNNGIIDDVHGANLNLIPHTGNPASVNFSQHGTHVAGLIAAQVNNGQGIAGPMGLNAKIIAINAWPPMVGMGTPNGSAPMSVIDRGIRYLTDHGAKVINISMQGEGLNPNIQDAMNYAAQRNTVVVVAAGNYAKEVGPNYIGVPSYYTKDIAGAISVAATNSANGVTAPDKCGFSNYSTSHVEIGAPGCDMNIFTSYGGNGILSCVPTGTDSSGYGYIQGTSMASPVAAAGALYTYALLKELAHLEPTAALVEDVLLKGSSVNAKLVGYTQDAKHLDLKSIYDYIQRTYVNPPNPGGGGTNPCPD